MTNYVETLYDGYGQCFTINKVLCKKQTKEWDLLFFTNSIYGTVFALNGIVQTTSSDEFIYHEMLTHVPIMAYNMYRDVKSVLIIGGGDGGILREVAKYRSIESITMVELDGDLIQMCKEYLPNHSLGAFSDPRLKLVIDDGAKFVSNSTDKFDVIISDCTDPVGPGEVLFSSSFYENCAKCLNENGIFVAQNGVDFRQTHEIINTKRRFSNYLQNLNFYQTNVPTYVGGAMTFAFASNNDMYLNLDVNRLREKFTSIDINTKYYNPLIHTASFALPEFVVKALEEAYKPDLKA